MYQSFLSVQDVMEGDLDLAAYLQKALGYGLTGDTSEECFFLLYRKLPARQPTFCITPWPGDCQSPAPTFYQ